MNIDHKILIVSVITTMLAIGAFVFIYAVDTLLLNFSSDDAPIYGLPLLSMIVGAVVFGFYDLYLIGERRSRKKIIQKGNTKSAL